MQIVINTRLLIKDKLDGIGWFTHETMKRMTVKNPDVHFIFAFDREFDEEFIYSENITPVILSPKARHPFLFIYWFEFSLGGLLRDLKPDLLLSPDGFLPLSGKTPCLPVMHDINFSHYPQHLPYLVRKYYNYYFPRFARKATRIATVSEFSKNDISSAYHVSPDKIDVVYNGVNENYKPLPEEEKRVVKRMVSSGQDYFLFVGSLHPRKNIPNLLKAFDLFKKSEPSGMKLIIAGSRYWWTSEEQSALDGMSHKSDVIFTGRLPQQELEKLTAAAFAIAYVPFFEGFGIPILEGMASGVPVITSDRTSMPEVAAGSSLLTNPASPEDISNAMRLMVKDEILRNQLISKGLSRVKEFSWDRTADLLWKSVEKSVNRI